ncbi:MAG: hypothetical protein ACM3H8_16580 [Sphingobacteriales bacterium]
MEKKNGTVRVLQLLFMAMLYGQILFAILVLVLVKAGLFNGVIETETERIFEAVCLGVSFIAIATAFVLFKRRIEQVKAIASLSGRFTEYRNACVIKYTLLEIPSLLAVVFYMLTAKWNFLLIAVMMIFIFMSQNPIRQRIKVELGVDDIEIDKINNLKE